MGNYVNIDGEEVLNSEAKPFEDRAHATVPKRWHEDNVKVIQTSEPSEEGTNE